MTQEPGDRIIKSLESAIAFERGDGSRASSTFVIVPKSANTGEPMIPAEEDDINIADHERASIHGALTLADNQCIVAVCEDGSGVVVARSDWIIERDILMETTTEDNGFDPYWDQGLTVGLYLMKISAWADGVDDAGISVEERTPLWAAPKATEADEGEMPLKGVWLDAKLHKPQGGMILWRYHNGTKWRLSIAYLADSGTYLDCGVLMVNGDMSKMTHFMEIPE
jgi:hypothetical protein